jgi:hypothetical protein
MNLQQWIDQHASLFVLIFPLYFLFLWLLVGAVISFVGGWFSLAKVYRAQGAFNGAKWKMQSGQMRWLANYNNVLTLGVNQQGLYLASRVCIWPACFFFGSCTRQYLFHGVR